MTISKAKLSTKIFSLGAFITLCFSLSFVVVAIIFKGNLIDYGKGNIKDVVDVAYTVMADYDAMVKKGVLPLEKAQQEAMLRIRNLRYGQDEYFWINDMEPKMIMHPFKPELEGRDLSGMKDPKGKYYFMEMVNVCNSKGEGYVEYSWPKPGMTKPVSKVSFVKVFKPWGWIIGSGIYHDDIQKGLLPILYTIFTVIFLVSLIGMSVSYLISRSVSNPINRIIACISEGADNVASASAQVSSASQQLASGSSEQTSSLDKTALSIESLTSITKQNADQAQKAKKMMDEVERTVENVNVNMLNMTEAISNVTKSSEETGKIIKTIDEIAFQTNLLALNAAVEAARAGEAGAGFAVVADEVRRLALRAATAAKDTNSLIENTMKDVIQGHELTKRTQAAFKENMELALKVASIVDDITIASGKQYQSIEEINRAVAAMEEVTQQAAASAEESASAAEEMNAQADQLRGFVCDMASLIGETRGALKNAEGPANLKRIGTKKRVTIPEYPEIGMGERIVF